MFYTVYKITNKINGKFYIGCHKTENLNDDYMGSGTILKRAIKKHGLENFSKEILHVYDTAEEMFAKEKELVYVSEETYNLKQGGDGGFDHVNTGPGSGEKKKVMQAGKILSERLKNDPTFNAKFRKACSEAQNRPEVIARRTEGLKKYYDANGGLWLGKQHTEETKRKMSEAAKGRVPWNKGIPRSEEDKKKISQGVRKFNGPVTIVAE